jgi:hypothetical protein
MCLVRYKASRTGSLSPLHEIAQALIVRVHDGGTGNGRASRLCAPVCEASGLSGFVGLLDQVDGGGGVVVASKTGSVERKTDRSKTEAHGAVQRPLASCHIAWVLSSPLQWSGWRIPYRGPISGSLSRLR